MSEDPGMDGKNWFVYCGDDPTNAVDQSGKETLGQAFAVGLTGAFYKELMQDMVEGAFGKHIDLALIINASVKTLINALIGTGVTLATSGAAKAGAEKVGIKLACATVGGAIGGTALGALAALKLGEHLAPVVYELFAMDMEAYE